MRIPSKGLPRFSFDSALDQSGNRPEPSSGAGPCLGRSSPYMRHGRAVTASIPIGRTAYVVALVEPTFLAEPPQPCARHRGRIQTDCQQAAFAGDRGMLAEGRLKPRSVYRTDSASALAMVDVGTITATYLGANTRRSCPVDVWACTSTWCLDSEAVWTGMTTCPVSGSVSSTTNIPSSASPCRTCSKCLPSAPTASAKECFDRRIMLLHNLSKVDGRHQQFS
jgi:hypothetical protein